MKLPQGSNFPLIAIVGIKFTERYNTQKSLTMSGLWGSLKNGKNVDNAGLCCI